MAYTKEFNLSPWKNKHISKTTPLGATRLNIMNNAISRNEDRTIELSEAAETAAGEMELTQEALAMLQSDYMRFKTEAGKVANMQIQNRKLYYNNKVVKPSDMVTYLSNGYKIVAEKDNILYTLSQYSIDDKRYAFSALVNSENRKPQTNVITLWNGAGGTDVFNYYSEYSVEVASTEELEQTNEALSDNSRNISLLWKLQRGQTAQFEKISSTAKEVTVPQGAISADVHMLGGMSRKGYQMLDIDLTNAYKARCNLVKNADGSITATATSDGTVYFGNYYGVPDIGQRMNNDCGYASVHEGDIITGHADGAEFCVLFVCDSNNIILSAINTKTSATKYITVPAGGVKATLRVEIGYMANAQVKTVYPMIEKGTTIHPYEPYTPNLIDSPVDEIVSVVKNKLGDDPNKRYPLELKKGDVITLFSYGIRTKNFELNLYDSATGARNDFFTLGANSSIRVITLAYDCKYISADPMYGYDEGANYMVVVGNYTGILLPYTPYRDPIALPIPQSIIDRCPDYGIGVEGKWSNEIDWVNKLYHHMGSRFYLSDLNWRIEDWGNAKNFYSQSLSGRIKAPSSYDSTADAICSKYDLVTINAHSTMLDGGISISYMGNNINIRDGRYTNPLDFKNSLSEVVLICELAEEEIIDLSDVITDSFADQLKTLEVEAGGTIEFNYPNSDIYDVAVPSTIEYCEKISEVEL